MNGGIGWNYSPAETLSRGNGDLGLLANQIYYGLPDSGSDLVGTQPAVALTIIGSLIGMLARIDVLMQPQNAHDCSKRKRIGRPGRTDGFGGADEHLRQRLDTAQAAQGAIC